MAALSWLIVGWVCFQIARGAFVLKWADTAGWWLARRAFVERRAARAWWHR
jgi:hypothetical protein